ncbi:hypothetical protein [Corynebacterium caspium]|uniref:hypothetical protein n=1 Tax=Corynebacterium caspium TaxID=234828 RepID=UPI00037BB32C|nr:hypothetical protein [Corynebacterium caspium]
MKSLMPKQILITGPLNTSEDVTKAVASAVYPPNRRLPRTLDGLADVIREYGITTIVCAAWHLPARQSQLVLAVLQDNGVSLIR